MEQSNKHSEEEAWNYQYILNKAIIAGIILILIGVAFYLIAVAMLFPALLFQLGNNNIWGYFSGGLIVAALFGAGGIISIIIGVIMFVINHAKNKDTIT